MDKKLKFKTKKEQLNEILEIIQLTFQEIEICIKYQDKIPCQYKEALANSIDTLSKHLDNFLVRN